MAIKRWCPICDGAGTDSFCGYTGVRSVGNIEDVYGIFLGSEIYESTDQAEYDALDDDYKEEYSRIVGMAFVFLTDGSRARTKLWGWFPGGTTTRAKLERLVSILEEPVTPEP